jgi:hypothetical protein
MKTIMTINPRRKKKAKKKSTTKKKSTSYKKKPVRNAGKKKGLKAMPKKRKAAKRKVTKRRRRRNPGLASRAKGVLSVKGIREAAVGALRQTGGALLSQFFAKKFAEGGGANDPNWTYKNYLLNALGALAAGVAAEVVRPGVGKDFLKGGLTLLAYKIFVNEVAPQNEFLMTNFGDSDMDMEYPEGDVYQDANGREYLLGQDGFWRPTDETHRLGEALISPSAIGDEYVSPGTLAPMGSTLATPSSLGAYEDPYQKVMGSDDYTDWS